MVKFYYQYLQEMYICRILYYCQWHYQHAAVAHKRADNYDFACISCSEIHNVCPFMI